MKNKNENMHIVELEFEGGSLEVVFFYEYIPGSPGSYDEPPEGDELKIISHKITWVDTEELEQSLLEYERDGGGRYNPNDDR
tara:strand:+ start:1058 stop:1303 length:246 start_codon:yes stop_codon:yes gene_type:complete